MRRLFAFFLRDFRIARSYSLNFVLLGVASGMSLVTLYFLSRALGDSPAFRAATGTSDYFSFALVGVSVATALRAVQTSFSSRLREAQTDGSLEVLLSAPLSTFQVVASLAVYPVVLSVVAEAGVLGVGALLGARLSVNFVGLVVTTLLSFAAFMPLGLLSAAYTLVFKRGDPFSFVVDALSYLFSGVLYPVAVLPPLFQLGAQILPATHALAALRKALLEDAPFSAFLRPWGALALTASVLWPLALLALSAARRHVERAGTLPQA